jgi:LysM repeat protein
VAPEEERGMSRARWAAVFVTLCLVATMLTGKVWGDPAVAGWGGAYETYTVRSGDTIQNIAQRFGVSADLIAAFNALSISAELTPGQDLAIPIPATVNEKGAESSFLARFPPRCAMVIEPSLVTKAPGGECTLGGFPVGSLVLVDASLPSYWRVGMLDGRTGWVDRFRLKVSNDDLAPGKVKALRKTENAYRRDMAKAEKAFDKSVAPARRASEKARAPVVEAYVRAVIQAGKDYDASRIPPTEPEAARAVTDAYHRAVGKAEKIRNKALERNFEVYLKASGPAYEAHRKAVEQAEARAKKARGKILAGANFDYSGRVVR